MCSLDFQGVLHLRRRIDFRRTKAARLFACLMRDAPPALYPFLRAIEQTPLAARGIDRNDAGDTEFRCLFDGPFETIEFDQRKTEGDLGRFGAGTQFLFDFEADDVAARAFDCGQPHPIVVRNLKRLPGFDAKHASEVLRAFSRDFRCAVANLIDEKSPPCHVQCLRYPTGPKMIALLRGTLVEKHPNQVVVDVGGVGYEVTIPISTFSKLPDTGAQTVLRTHTHVREDIFALYGFLTQDEKALFEKLIGVSNIGPGLAIKVLSGMAIEELIDGIRRGEVERLVRIPGVGRKTAERMVLELRDKLPALTAGEQSTAGAPALSSIDEDVMSALLNLGCARPAAEAAVRKARAGGAPGEFEPLFRKALELVR